MSAASKVLSVLGKIWAAPVTLVGLLYVLPLWAAKWYTFEKVSDGALFWQVNPNKAPMWLLKLWSRFLGQTLGNVVVIRRLSKDTSFVDIHELCHVRQYERMGIFFLVFYGLFALGILWGCRGLSVYQDNPFEAEARKTEE